MTALLPDDRRMNHPALDGHRAGPPKALGCAAGAGTDQPPSNLSRIASAIDLAADTISASVFWFPGSARTATLILRNAILVSNSRVPSAFGPTTSSASAVRPPPIPAE